MPTSWLRFALPEQSMTDTCGSFVALNCAHESNSGSSRHCVGAFRACEVARHRVCAYVCTARRQSDYVLGPVKHVVRFESLQTDLDRLVELGVLRHSVSNLPTKAEAKNASTRDKKKGWRDYFAEDDLLFQAVEAFYDKDFSQFGYEKVGSRLFTVSCLGLSCAPSFKSCLELRRYQSLPLVQTVQTGTKKRLGPCNSCLQSRKLPRAWLFVGTMAKVFFACCRLLA